MGPIFTWMRLSLVEIGNGFADSAFLQDLLAIRHAHQEGGGTQAVHLSGDALGVIVDPRQGIIGKERSSFVAREGDLVTDIGHRLGQIERGEMVGGGEALVKGLIRSQAQRAAHEI